MKRLVFATATATATATAIASTLSVPASADLFGKMNETLKKATDKVNVELQKISTTETSQSTEDTATSSQYGSFGAPDVDAQGFCSSANPNYQVKGISIGLSAEELNSFLLSQGATQITDEFSEINGRGSPAGIREMSWSMKNSDMTIGGHTIDGIYLKQGWEQQHNSGHNTALENFKCRSFIRVETNAPVANKSSFDNAMKNKFGDTNGHIGEWTSYGRPRSTIPREEYNHGTTGRRGKFESRDTPLTAYVSLNFQLDTTYQRTATVTTNTDDF